MSTSPPETGDRYRSLFLRCLAGIYVADLEGRVLECNEALARILGFDSRDQLLAERQALLPAEAAPGARARDLPTWTNVEAKLEKRDGSVVWVLKNEYLAVEKDATVVHGTLVDITERKREEQQRGELREQLRQAQKMEAVGRLAGGIAHDFNNLLNVILNYTGFVIDELGERDPIRQDVEEVRRAADRAAALTRQLLVFSRKQIVQPAVLDLNGVVAEMERLLKRTLGEQVELRTVLAPSLLRVNADPGHIEQVVMNLAINARDAMPDGGRLTLETAEVERAPPRGVAGVAKGTGRYVLLSVSDTGCGMTDEVRNRAFEPFFTTKPVGRGTGLGLSTVYGIVQQAGGFVEVTSAPGQGTTVRIHLPATDKPVTGALRAVKRSPALQQGRGEIVLVVEDQDAVRALTCRILSRHGYSVLEARGAGEALLASERHDGPIQMLLTDVVMPQMSGRELARRLTRLRPDMKVLYVSGGSEESTGELPLSACLAKPFTEHALLARLREVLDGT